MSQFNKHGYFKSAEPIISNPKGHVKEFLKNSMLSFFDEMDFYIDENKDFGFWKYQHERTFLSMYLNGIIRNDKNKQVSLLQEYGVWDDTIRMFRGRCDAFVNYKKNAIMIEAKRDFDNIYIKDEHWNIEAWLEWDYEKIGRQLENYYEAQKRDIVKEDYSSLQLMTLMFGLVKINPVHHFEESKRYLGTRINDGFPKDWFYTFLFEDQMDERLGLNTGLEIYGTLKTMSL